MRFLSQSLSIKTTILKLLLIAIGKLFCCHFLNKSIRKVECKRSGKGERKVQGKFYHLVFVDLMLLGN